MLERYCEGKPVLVFCPTRKGEDSIPSANRGLTVAACQSTATEIATKYKSVKASGGKLPWLQAK
jgi:hypothetical protein